MGKRDILPALLASVMSMGCVDTFQVIHTTSFKPATLDQRDKVVVATPVDGRFESRVYRGSGKLTNAALTQAFQRHAVPTIVMPMVMDRSATLEAARRYGAELVAYPEILHWEDRATEWNGKPDKIRVKVTLLRVQTGEAIDQVELAGESKYATVGGAHPQDLLGSPIETWVAALYGDQPVVPERDARGGHFW